jgi:hypothetical protein
MPDDLGELDERVVECIEAGALDVPHRHRCSCPEGQEDVTGSIVRVGEMHFLCVWCDRTWRRKWK